MKNFSKNIILWIIIGLLLVALFNLFQGTTSNRTSTNISFSDFIAATEAGKVSEVNRGENASIILESGIECRFHKRGVQWADNINKGDEVYVDGILKRISLDNILMSPVGLRDPTASFKPTEK